MEKFLGFSFAFVCLANVLSPINTLEAAVKVSYISFHPHGVVRLLYFLKSFMFEMVSVFFVRRMIWSRSHSFNVTVDHDPELSNNSTK